MNIKEVWRIFKGSSMQDKDMQRVFQRAATPNACLELLEENDELERRIKTVIKWCQANIEDETIVSGFAVQIRDYLDT